MSQEEQKCAGEAVVVSCVCCNKLVRHPYYRYEEDFYVCTEVCMEKMKWNIPDFRGEYGWGHKHKEICPKYPHCSDCGGITTWNFGFNEPRFHHTPDCPSRIEYNLSPSDC